MRAACFRGNEVIELTKVAQAYARFAEGNTLKVMFTS
jgi:hypothetical protein